MSAPFTQIPRAVTNDRQLSLKALGLYVFIADKPLDWVFSAERIAGMKSDGRKSVINALRELESAGYLTRSRHGDGKVSYTLSQSAERDIGPKCRKGTQGTGTQSAEKAKCQKGQVPKGTRISKIDPVSNTHKSSNTHSGRPSGHRHEDELTLSGETVQEPVLTFPTRNGKLWPLYPPKVAEWQTTFPGIDILAECRKARQWLIDNPTRRKTVSGMAKFLIGWLGRADPPQTTTSDEVPLKPDGTPDFDAWAASKI